MLRLNLLPVANVAVVLLRRRLSASRRSTPVGLVLSSRSLASLVAPDRSHRRSPHRQRHHPSNIITGSTERARVKGNTSKGLSRWIPDVCLCCGVTPPPPPLPVYPCSRVDIDSRVKENTDSVTCGWRNRAERDEGPTTTDSGTPFHG